VVKLVHNVADMIAGVISDTHGLLRPEVFDVFKDVELILHAGDIGGPDILKQLKTIAPTVAVRGNNDKESWAARIPEHKVVRLGSFSIYMIHDIKEMLKPALSANVVISGHSHRPSIDRRGGILYLNPGSAGPRRFKLPICVARLTTLQTSVDAELVELL
jgi:putative phosphoesterase